MGLCFITSHIHSWVLFSLWLCLFILSWVISPLISRSIRASTDPGSSSFSVISFCLFTLFMGLSRQEYWSGLPFPPPVDHVLSELSTMTCPFWVALHGLAHSFIELDKAVIHVISLFSVITVFILSAIWWIKIRGLWKLPNGRDRLWGVWVLLWRVYPIKNINWAPTVYRSHTGYKDIVHDLKY